MTGAEIMAVSVGMFVGSLTGLLFVGMGADDPISCIIGALVAGGISVAAYAVLKLILGF